MKIHISRYPVFMKIGLHSGERLTGQEIYISLEADIGTSFLASPSEDLGDTVDYGKLIAEINAALQDREIKLVEAVVTRLGRQLLHSFAAIRTLHLWVEKPILPDGLGRGAQVSVSHTFVRPVVEQ